MAQESQPPFNVGLVRTSSNVAPYEGWTKILWKYQPRRIHTIQLLNNKEPTLLFFNQTKVAFY